MIKVSNIKNKNIQNIKNKDDYIGTISIVKNEQFFWDYNNYFEKNKFIRSYDCLDWIVIGSTQFSSNYSLSEKRFETSYKLLEGDLFKLGKLIFLVRKIKLVENENKKVNESFISNSINNNSNMNLLNNSINEELIIYKQNKKNINLVDILGSTKTLGQQKTNKEKDMKNDDENNINSNSINNKLKYIYIKLKNVNEKNLKPLKCRICFSEGNFEGKNPLISPCNCTGSVKYIHLTCLRKWLTSKLNKKSSASGNIYCYSFKSLECEICKTIIPEQVEFRGNIISLLDFKDIEPPYLVLQTMNQYSPQNQTLEYNVIFVMSFKLKNYLVLGRANNSDIKLNDISVSRNHSIISYDNGEFYIDDIGSKFGTLLLIQNNILFLPYKEITIQTGACHLVFYLIRTFLGCFKCYKNKSFEKLTYEKYLSYQERKVFSQIIENLNNNIVDPIEKFGSINNSYNSDDKNNNLFIDNEKEDKDSNDKNTVNEQISKDKENENENGYANHKINNADIDNIPTLNINEIQNKEINHKLNKTGSFIIRRLSNSLNSYNHNEPNDFHKQNESNEMLFQEMANRNNYIKNMPNNGTYFSIMNILKKHNKNKKPITVVNNKYYNNLNKNNFSYSLGNNNKKQNKFLHNTERNVNKNNININEDAKNVV